MCHSAIKVTKKGVHAPRYKSSDESAVIVEQRLKSYHRNFRVCSSSYKRIRVLQTFFFAMLKPSPFP